MEGGDDVGLGADAGAAFQKGGDFCNCILIGAWWGYFLDGWF